MNLLALIAVGKHKSELKNDADTVLARFLQSFHP
jgi:hypothetical protein